MMRRWLLTGVALLAAGACRTQIQPVVKTTEEAVYVPDQGCDVRDYGSATDVPDGATNLGWVTVKTAGDQDETFKKLREKICQMGGDALSQPHWEHEAGEYEPSLLKANAWRLP